MKKLFNKICNGYLGLLFPLIVSFILLEKLHNLLLPVTHWVESQLHITRLLGVMGVFVISIFLMLLLGYLCGLLLGSPYVKRQMEKYESSVLSKIPMYNLIKTVFGSQTGVESQSHFHPALLYNDDGFSLCYVTSETEQHYAVCLVRGGLNGGEVKIVLKEKVRLLNISLPEFSRLIKQYGINAAVLVEKRFSKEHTN